MDPMHGNAIKAWILPREYGHLLLIVEMKEGMSRLNPTEARFS